MSNTDKATHGSDVIHDVDFAHRVADLEDSLRTDIKNGSMHFLGRTLERFVYLKDQVEELRARSYDDIQARDSRVAHLWQKLWDALDGDIEQDETWGMFMDAIPGLPDFRTKTWEVEIPLDPITVEVEAKDEDEAIELAKEKAEGDYCLSDVFQEQYIEAREI